MQHPGAEADEGVGAKKREQEIQHDAIKAFPSISAKRHALLMVSSLNRT
jgi:hypothetical protein